MQHLKYEKLIFTPYDSWSILREEVILTEYIHLPVWYTSCVVSCALRAVKTWWQPVFTLDSLCTQRINQHQCACNQTRLPRDERSEPPSLEETPQSAWVLKHVRRFNFAVARVSVIEWLFQTNDGVLLSWKREAVQYSCVWGFMFLKWATLAVTHYHTSVGLQRAAIKILQQKSCFFFCFFNVAKKLNRELCSQSDSLLLSCTSQ